MRTVGKKIQRKEKKITKKEVIDILTDKGIEFDKNAKVEELLALIPKE